MIKIEHVEISGWSAALRGMRNAMDSHEQADSFKCNSVHTCCYEESCPRYDKSIAGCNYEYADEFIIGTNDLKLASKLANAGTDHGKFLRFIHVDFDLTAPLYLWKQASTYRVGMETNSESTMHCIHKKEFTADDFSWEATIRLCESTQDGVLYILNKCRDLYLETKDKKYWNSIIQLLPDSYNQKRTVTLNYAVLRNMYHARKNHKLDEWHDFCAWIETLPYADELIVGAK